MPFEPSAPIFTNRNIKFVFDARNKRSQKGSNWNGVCGDSRLTLENLAPFDDGNPPNGEDNACVHAVGLWGNLCASLPYECSGFCNIGFFIVTTRPTSDEHSHVFVCFDAHETRGAYGCMLLRYGAQCLLEHVVESTDGRHWHIESIGPVFHGQRTVMGFFYNEDGSYLIITPDGSLRPGLIPFPLPITTSLLFGRHRSEKNAMKLHEIRIYPSGGYSKMQLAREHRQLVINWNAEVGTPIKPIPSEGEVVNPAIDRTSLRHRRSVRFESL